MNHIAVAELTSEAFAPFGEIGPPYSDGGQAPLDAAVDLSRGTLRFYSLVFGFEDGDPERPNVAAGKAIEAYFRIAFCYKGAFLYKMRAGMGDVVFAPLYEVLRQRRLPGTPAH